MAAARYAGVAVVCCHRQTRTRVQMARFLRHFAPRFDEDVTAADNVSGYPAAASLAVLTFLPAWRAASPLA